MMAHTCPKGARAPRRDRSRVQTCRRLLRICIVASMSGAAMLWPIGATAQDPLPIGCESCTVTFDTVAVLGEQDGPGMIPSESIRLAQDAAGRYIVLSGENASIQVFSPEGAFVRSIGGEGEGPGEFRWPQSVASSEDGSIYVLDPMLARITVFGPDFQLDRTIRVSDVTLGFDVIAARGDSLILSGYSRDRELFGYAGHVIAPDGRLIRSFGAPDYPIPSSDPYRLMAALAPSASGAIWVGRKDRYVVGLWSDTGQRVMSYQRDVEWFERPDPVPDAPPPPRPILVTLQEDPEGLLWLQFLVAGEEWTTAALPSAFDSHGWRMEDRDNWMDTVVEVIDPQEGFVVASRRLPGRRTPLFGDRLVAKVETDLEREEVRVFVLKMRVDRQGG